MSRKKYPWCQLGHQLIFNRYLLVELLPPLSMGLLIFASALMLISIRDVLDILLLSGAPLGPVMKVVLYIYPPLLTMSLPIGSLLAAMLVYGRLADDRELTAMRAAGVSTFAMVAPGVVLAVLLTALNLYWTSNVTPKVMELLKQTQWKLVQQMTSISWIKPGQFNAPQDDLAFYFTGMVPGTNTIKDITIFKSSASNEDSWFGSDNKKASNWTVSAPTAQLVPKPSQGVLEINLQNCVSEELQPEKMSRVLIESATITFDIGQRLAGMTGRKFSRDQTSFASLMAQARDRYERYLAVISGIGFQPGDRHSDILAAAQEILATEQQQPGSCPVHPDELANLRRYIHDVQKSTNKAMLRLTYPVATFFFFMIGMPLGISTGKGKRTVSVVITVGVLLFYYSVQKIGETLSESYATQVQFDPGLAMWFPNFVLMLLAAGLLWKISKY